MPEENFVLLVSVVHQQMLNHALDKQLQEEQASRNELQLQLNSVTTEFNKLSEEKSEMLRVLNSKVQIFTHARRKCPPIAF